MLIGTFWHPHERWIAALHVKTPVTGVTEQHVILYSTGIHMNK